MAFLVDNNGRIEYITPPTPSLPVFMVHSLQVVEVYKHMLSTLMREGIPTS